jgi:hypothetical protein
MPRGTIYDANGRVIDDTDIVPDGGYVSVRAMFMDGNLSAHTRRSQPRYDCRADPRRAGRTDRPRRWNAALRKELRHRTRIKRLRVSAVQRGHFALEPVGDLLALLAHRSPLPPLVIAGAQARRS